MLYTQFNVYNTHLILIVYNTYPVLQTQTTSCYTQCTQPGLATDGSMAQKSSCLHSGHGAHDDDD